MAPAKRTAKRGPRRVNPKRKKALPAFEPAPRMTEAPRKKRVIPYTPELGEEICQRIANGASGVQICKDPDMPDWPTIARWVKQRKDFAEAYREARELQAQYWADSIIDIADDATNDYMNRQRRDGAMERVFDRESFERSRLRVQGRQWMVSRLLRQVYGDRIGVTGGDGESPVGIKVETKNELIDSILSMIQPKPDGQNKPNTKKREP